MTAIRARDLGPEHEGRTLQRDRKIDRTLYRIETVTNTPTHVALIVRRAHATQHLILTPHEQVDID